MGTVTLIYVEGVIDTEDTPADTKIVADELIKFAVDKGWKIGVNVCVNLVGEDNE